MITRRELLRGLGASLLAAPVIVRAASLMSISPLPVETEVMTLTGGGLEVGDVVSFNGLYLKYDWLHLEPEYEKFVVTSVRAGTAEIRPCIG